jgi:glycosyltransferase involved in cell wall biosynthesis
MKVLMFGWEFPPFNAGGLGTACHGLVKSLSEKNVEVLLVLPFHCDIDFARVIGMKNVKVKRIDLLIQEYVTSSRYNENLEKKKKNKKNYCGSLFEEVKRYAEDAKEIAKEEEFDVIHAHDWLTYEAGIAAKEITGKPLVVHVHATEFDRTGGNGINTFVYEIEKRGMETADMIVAVSNFTKEKIMKYYGINSRKIIVIHNAVEDFPVREFHFPIKDHNKIVLFLGRITLQKGPDYFVYTAKRISEFIPNAKFLVAGDGDMKKFMIDEAARLNILDRFIFTGFVRGEDLEKTYKLSDVYVMPSVSEPFGITALEALSTGCPSILSKQSGVSEVVRHALKVDFWDTEEMANKIISILKYKELAQCMRDNSLGEVKRFKWSEVADKCIKLYETLTRQEQ